MTDFKWIGTKVDCYNRALEKGWFDFYRSFSYGGEQFNIGDFVLINKTHNPKLVRVGKLICVYHSHELWNKDAPYRGIVRWYNLARDLDKKFNAFRIELDENNEVIEDAQDTDVFISLKHIQKKCVIVLATVDDPVHLIKHNNLDPEVYFSCRYRIEYSQLVPIFSNNGLNKADYEAYVDNSELCLSPPKLIQNSDYIDLTSDLESSGVKEMQPNEDISCIIIDSSPLPTMTPSKLTKHKRKSNSTESSTLDLNCESIDTVDKDAGRVRSPSNPLKNIKLTPDTTNKKVNGLRSLSRIRNSSVKRVLNDSFENIQTSPSGLPILSYSIVNESNEDAKHIKIKLKLTENQGGGNLRVYPTVLDSQVVGMNSPIKVYDLCEVENRIMLSPDAKAAKLPLPRRRSVRTAEKCQSPAKIGLQRRRSSRTLDRKLYADYESPEQVTPKKRSRRISTNSRSVGGKTALSIIEEEQKNTNKSKIVNGCASESLEINATPGNIRPKRSVGPPKKYMDDGDSNISKKETKKSPSVRSTSYVSRENCDDTDSEFENRVDKKQLRNSSRSTTKQDEECENNGDNDNVGVKESSVIPDSALKRSVGRPKKSVTIGEVTPRPKRSVGRPKKYASSDESDSADSKHCHGAKNTPTRNLRKSVLKELDYAELPKNHSPPKTPRTPRQRTQASTPKSTLKNTPSARAKMVREGIITPSIQARQKAILKDNTPLSKARTQLHVSCVPTALPCRENEFANIISFLEGKLLDGCGGCMYVSGVPGTGKTATVTEVIKSLQQSVENQDVPAFKYINVNGMKLSEPRQCYVEIVKQLMGKTVPWEEAQTMLENKFVRSPKTSVPVILIVDELDILCTKRQDVVYNLLDWPSKTKAQLIVITIANTMDLPERLLMGRVTSRLGLTRLTFQAYTHKQLQEIVTKRLTGTNAFNPDAIQLVARKVASVSGDARRALDICRRAAEIAELEGKHTLVSMTHVNQALNAMITQPKVQAIKRCSRLEKLILQAVVAEVERTGVEETHFATVLTMLVSIAALDGFQMVSNTIAMAAVNKLSACRLLLTDQKCNIYQKIILNVSTDDVYYALTKTDL